MNSNFLGAVVQYTVGGTVAFFGVAEYVRGGWVGIRQADGRLDEAPVGMVVPDPT